MAGQAPRAERAEAVKWLAANWWAIPTLAAILLLAWWLGRQKPGPPDAYGDY